MLGELSLIQAIAVWTLPLLLGLTWHEAAHAWAASRLGDDTARRQGQMTLNPLPNIDPIGTVLVPSVLLLLSSIAGSGLLFGWARPTPTDLRNLRNPSRDMAVIAAAGPASNLLMAVFWAVLMRAGLSLQAGGNETIGLPLALMGQAGILANLLLCILNLLPLPPLDGSRIVQAFLPPRWRDGYFQLARYGLSLLLIALFTGLLATLLIPPLTFLYGLLLALVVL